MRVGFTTGSCSAASAKASVYMLLTGRPKNTISITTPKGLVFNAEIHDIEIKETEASCSIIKDGGDDPDITTGVHIVSTVSLIESDHPCVLIEGGKGIGRVTLPGLDQKVGESAINHVPREMITKEVLEVTSLLGYRGGVKVVISCPEGEEISKKTFNPRLGIIGGISILGTSGVVEPMSLKALRDTIEVEIKQKKALGLPVCAVTPGNYGLSFMKEEFGYNLDLSVKCSNFIGESLHMAKEAGFSKFLLTGHIGKLIKLSGGIMYTHSHEGDCRMELLCAHALRAGGSRETLLKILDCVVTEEALRLIEKEGLLKETMNIMLHKILKYLNFREDMDIGVMVYSNDFGLLAESSNALPLLKENLGGQ